MVVEIECPSGHKCNSYLRGTITSPAAARPNQRWSMDFVSDCVSTGKVIRMLTMVDDCTRECPGIEVDTSLGGLRVRRVLVSGVAVVVWASASVAGLRFLYLEPHCRAGFQAWLDSMEAQLRFRESAHDSRMCSQHS